MTKPLVSILIPCYNAEPWLAETLESALGQTWANTEVIVVDDGSTDSSLAIAHQFDYPHLKIIHQANQGASAARNRALQNAQGDFIQFLDADDLLATDKLQRQLSVLMDNPTCVAAGEWARFYNTKEEATFTAQPLWTDLSPIDWLVLSWQGHWMMHPAAWLVPRPIIEQAGSWHEDLSLNDDGEYFCRVLLASQGVKFCWGAKSYYRSGNLASLSASKSRTAWESAFHSLELGANALLQKDDSDRVRQACATVFQRFIYEVYPDVPDLQEKAKSYVQAFGGSDLLPSGGTLFHLFRYLLGWKKAKTMQKMIHRHGYQKVALGWRLTKLYSNRIAS